MGRYYWNKRDTVESSQNFNIGFLKKHKYLEGVDRYGSINWSRNGEPTGSIGITMYFDEYPHLNLDYSITSISTGEKRLVNYDVRLISTPCKFGGKRWWFLCWRCGNKTSAIYRVSGDKFLCRKCNNLAYESQNRNRRGVWYQVGKVLDEERQEKLPQYWRKYRYYCGKPTKNYLRLLHSRREILRSTKFLKNVGWF